MDWLTGLLAMNVLMAAGLGLAAYREARRGDKRLSKRLSAFAAVAALFSLAQLTN
jgi:low temperature requirement protein LtrA